MTRGIDIVRTAVVVTLFAGIMVTAPFLPAPTASAELTPVPDQIWGVQGLGPTGAFSQPSPVWAIEQIGNTIYVGGRFTEVIERRDLPGFDQPYLAAFDATTGIWIDWWRPVVDGPVYSLEASPDGSQLFVGGEFSNINGQPFTRGLAAIDPVSALVDSSWVASLDRLWTTAPPFVRNMRIANGYVYIAGSFTHVESVPQNTRTSVWRVARVSLADGTPDKTWKPKITGGTVFGIDVSPDGSRVYLGGLFNALNDAPDSGYFGIVDTVTGATVPGLPQIPFNSSQRDKYDVLAVGDLVFVGGSQHIVQVFNASDMSQIAMYFTGAGANNLSGGGDFQDIELVGDRVYASCHCARSVWRDSFFLADVNGIIAMDAATGQFVDTYSAEIGGSRGPWAMHGGADGCLWIGGDVNRQAWGDPYNNNIIRQCDEAGQGPPVAPPIEQPPADVTPPTSSQLSLNWVTETAAKVSWTDATDNIAVAYYNLYRDGAVVHATPGTSFRDGNVVEGLTHAYTVEAVDNSGNVGPMSAPLDVTIQGDPPDPLPAGTVLAADFTAGTDGFGYVDDAFRGTSQPAYANGSRLAAGAFDGAGLEVRVGGLDGADIVGMSGGWAATFTLEEDAETTLSFQYQLTMEANYESDELSQALVSVDGVLYGTPPDDFLAQFVGDGNGGGAMTTGWQQFTVDLGSLVAGDHTLVIGGFNNKKTTADESAQVLIDDVLVVVEIPEPEPDPTMLDLINTGFDADAAPFAYVDDLFRGTAAPAYADGSYVAAGAFNGGGLKFDVGGLDNVHIFGMSGGWLANFNLAEDLPVMVTLRYILNQSRNLEPDESTEVLVAIDGVLHGTPPDDFVARIDGDGNGGPAMSTGWQEFTVDLGVMTAGDHTLAIGGYQTKKTWNEETSEILFDDVHVWAVVDAPPDPVAVEVLNAAFDANEQGFLFQDDPFRATAAPAYAVGSYQSALGRDGGGLEVVVGGVDGADIIGMSGGWQSDFVLAQDADVTVTFWYVLSAAATYEADEFSQALVTVDGVLYGTPLDDFIAQLVGDGNGGAIQTTGWQEFTVDLTGLTAGTHSVVIGGFNNKKTFDDETTTVVIDDVVVTALYAG